MEDAQIHAAIEQLVAEEHRLWEDEAHGGNSNLDKQRLTELRVALDMCWDLLRQRHALAARGFDINAAQPRDPAVVENYLQ